MIRLVKTAGQRGLVLLAAVLLAACGSTVKLDETPVESRTPTIVNADGTAPAAAAPGRGGTSSGTAAQSPVATVNLPGTSSAAGFAPGSTGSTGSSGSSALGRVIYFDFDSYGVRDDARSLIENHAKQLAAQRSKRLVIEGHTDDRGGREYNLALGQKRAEAVAKALALLGATESQIEAVSFGKERPTVEGQDEAAWAKNRRAELKDR